MTARLLACVQSHVASAAAVASVSMSGGDELPDRAAIQHALDRVLARREFQPPEPSWSDQLKRWVIDHLLHGIGRLFSWIDLSTTTGKVVVVLLLIVLALIVAHIVWSVTRMQSGEGGRTRWRAQGATAAAADERDLLAQARADAAAGRFLEAMHALYQGTLRWLDARGLVRYDEGKTGGDYAREIAAADARRWFRGLLDSFYPVAFGGRPAARAAFERMHAAARSMGIPA